jgi:hypothetical protein
MIQKLEDRRLLNADWISVISSQDPPEQIWEGESAGAYYEFDTTTPYLLYDVEYSDGIGGTSGSWTLSGGGEATYDDNGGYALSMDLMEDQGWAMQSVWHQDWYLGVENVAPSGTLSTDLGDNGDGLVTMELSAIQEPSQADRDAGIRFAWGYDYAQLEYNWDNNRTTDAAYSFDPTLDADQQYYFRVGDKDNGHSDYSSTLGPLPTLNVYGAEVTSTSIPLHWIDTASGEAHWIVQRAPYNGGSFSTIRTLDGVAGSGSPISFTDDTCDPDTRYVYHVRAEGNGADTPYSPKVYVSTLLPTPSEVYASNVSGGGNVAEVHWTQPESDHLSGFAVSCFNSSGVRIGTAKQVSAAARSVTFTTADGLTTGGNYTFSVTALSSDGQHDSDASAPVDNFDEPSGPNTTVYHLDGPGDPTPHNVGEPSFEWQGDDLGNGVFSDVNGTLTMTLENLPRHTYALGWLEFYMTFYDPNAQFSAEIEDGTALQVSQCESPPVGDYGGYFGVSLAELGTPDDALKHDDKSLVIKVQMENLPEDRYWYGWDINEADVWTYFPFVGVVAEGNFTEGSTDTKLRGTRIGTGGSQTVLQDALSLKVADTPGSAAKGTDYNVADSLSISAGALSGTTGIGIVNDTTPEWTEDFQIEATPKGNCRIYGSGTLGLEIVDNDLAIDGVPPVIKPSTYCPVLLSTPEAVKQGARITMSVPYGAVVSQNPDGTGWNFTGSHVWISGVDNVPVVVYIKATSSSIHEGDFVLSLSATDATATPPPQRATSTSAATEPATARRYELSDLKNAMQLVEDEDYAILTELQPIVDTLCKAAVRSSNYMEILAQANLANAQQNTIDALISPLTAQAVTGLLVQSMWDKVFNANGWVMRGARGRFVAMSATSKALLRWTPIGVVITDWFVNCLLHIADVNATAACLEAVGDAQVGATNEMDSLITVLNAAATDGYYTADIHENINEQGFTSGPAQLDQMVAQYQERFTTLRAWHQTQSSNWQAVQSLASQLQSLLDQLETWIAVRHP